VRHIDVASGSSWVDTQLVQLQKGQALPVILAGDDTRWKQYWSAARQAAAAGIGLFDTDYCRSGPSQSTPLRLWVNWDANGYDTANGEYVRVLNNGTTALSVAGWQIRTGGQDSYTLPSSAVIPAGGLLTLYVGQGTNTSTSFYWGGTAPKFANANVALNQHGSGGYLFDRDGDLRAWSIYPCIDHCYSILTGKVSMSVRADAAGVDADNVNGEYVLIRPVPGIAGIDISYQVASANGYTYEFPKGTVIRAGETLVLRMGKGTRTRLNQYWGNSTSVLANGGGMVEVRTPEGVRAACKVWGTGHC
jgi:hypothetical protein